MNRSHAQISLKYAKTPPKYVLMNRERTSLSALDSSFEEDEYSWISYFCGLKGNEFFCEVDPDFIRDRFNLKGLENQVSHYQMAIRLILGLESFENLSEDQQDELDAQVVILYGLIHARFILTRYGQYAMYEKFQAAEFGRCPRLKCQNQPVLPVGLYDSVKMDSVKLFCPSCKDVFQPNDYAHQGIDGAFFGTTFPHLFLLELPEEMPLPPKHIYVPRVFGYQLHESWQKSSLELYENTLRNSKGN